MSQNPKAAPTHTLAECRRIFRVSKRLVKALKSDDPKEIIDAAKEFETLLPVAAKDDDDAVDEKKRKELEARLTALEKRSGLK